MQGPELPGPRRGRLQEALIARFAFLLTVNEITTLEGGLRVSKSRLRAVMTAGQPAGKSQKGEPENYGIVCPFEEPPPPVIFPPPMHPRCMFSMFSVKQLLTFLGGGGNL